MSFISPPNAVRFSKTSLNWNCQVFCLFDCFFENTKNLLDRQGCIRAVFLDLKQAFYTISHHVLLAKLSSFNNKAIFGMKSYLSNRVQAVQIIMSISPYLNYIAGFPQGSILGLILFSLYVNDLHVQVSTLSCVQTIL